MKQIFSLMAVASALFVAVQDCDGQETGVGKEQSKQIADAKRRLWEDASPESNNANQELPKLSGVWWNEGGQKIVITQDDKNFTAKCVWIHPRDGDIHWQLTGTVSIDRHLTGRLIHTKAPEAYQNQIHIAIISKSGETINGRAVFDAGGGHDLIWKRDTLVETDKQRLRDTDSVTVGTATFTAEQVATAFAIIDAQARRSMDLAAAERELASIKNAKIVSEWSRLYEKINRPDFGRVVGSPNDYVVVKFKRSDAQRIKDYGVRDTEFRINEIRDAMKGFDDGRYVMPPMPDLVLGEFKTGRVGNLKSPNNDDGAQPYKIEAKVLQVLPASDALVTMLDETVLVKGISTKDLTDGRRVVMSGTYRVVGTKMYKSVVGTNTVFVIEPYAVPKELIKYLMAKQ